MSTSIDPDWLSRLRCPATRDELRLASEDELLALNERVRGKTARNVAGETVSEELEAALLRSDGAVAYPIRAGIPRLLVEEGIALEPASCGEGDEGAPA